jgi:hypothetical protein
MHKCKTYFLITLAIFFFQGCKKVKNVPVPNVPVEVIINLTLPSYAPLINVGGWCYVTGGSRGIVVYRRSLDEFVAFDRHSSATPNESSCVNPIIVSTTNALELIDECSSAKFSLYDGSAITGSDFGLRQYQTFFDGNSSLRIYN